MRPSDAKADDITLWVGACRYYLGRRTYAVGNFCELLRRCWPDIDSDARAIIKRDVDMEFGDDERRRQQGDVQHLPLGDNCDREEWIKVRDLWAPRKEGSQ